MEIIEQIQHKTVQERIYIIEQILQTLKRDMNLTSQIMQKPRKPFRVRTFDLGQEVYVDRDTIYYDLKSVSPSY